jgi:glycerol-3-phosphate dehydrogenase (NAD(P)+)
MSAERNTVLILGYGEMGHAMEHLLEPRHEMLIWQRRPRNDPAAIDLDHAAQRAEFVLFCIPAPPHHDLCIRLLPTLSRDAVCISIAKGVDNDGRTAFQVFDETLGDKCRHGVLYGPMISEEMRADKPSFAQFGTPDNKTFKRVARLFEATPLYLEHSTDLTGISWSAVLKNVYAIAFGIADELDCGDNLRGFLTVDATREIESIVTLLGGRTSAPYHLAGLGDLVTTATSEGSHHHQLGRRLARGQFDVIEGEGAHTLHTLQRQQLFDSGRFPLYRFIETCIRDPSDVPRRLQRYLDDRYAHERQDLVTSG